MERAPRTLLLESGNCQDGKFRRGLSQLSFRSTTSNVLAGGTDAFCLSAVQMSGSRVCLGSVVIS